MASRATSNGTPVSFALTLAVIVSSMIMLTPAIEAISDITSFASMEFTSIEMIGSRGLTFAYEVTFTVRQINSGSRTLMPRTIGTFMWRLRMN